MTEPTWEARMSARAQKRMEADRLVEAARAEAEYAATREQSRQESETTPEYLAGPPCRNCYEWVEMKLGGYTWAHIGQVVPGHSLKMHCVCSCHPSEECWYAVVLAAAEIPTGWKP